VYQLRESTACSKCNSSSIVPKVRIVDRAHYNLETDLTLVVYDNPDALMFKGGHSGQLSAWLCGECGYTEFYVENASYLYKIYEQSKSKAE
jgi:ribosomal protein S27AE